MPSEQYSEGIYAPLRQTKAVVRFALVAPEAKKKARVMFENQNPMSRYTQIKNNVSDMGGRMATFEPGYWKLDGSFLLPLPPKETDFEIGWWGKNMSDGDRALDSDAVIEVIFIEPQNIAVFGIAFDTASGQAISDLSIEAHDSGGRLIFQEDIRDNTKTYIHTGSGATGVSGIFYRLYKTSEPYRYPRVTELDFGLVLTFDDEQILNLSTIREADPLGKSVPLNHLRMRITNNGQFDQLDRNSYGAYLQKRQAFEYRHGLERDGGVEWIYGGVYYMDDWTVNDSYVEFNALGAASLLESRTYDESSLTVMPVGQLIQEVAKKTGMGCQIPDSLLNSPGVCGYLGNVDCRKAVAMMAELSCTMVYENRRNTLFFVDWQDEQEASDRLDYENMFEPPDVKLGVYYNGVILKEITLSTVREQLVKVKETVKGSKSVKLYFDSPLYGNPAVTVTQGFTLSNAVYKTMYMTATLTGNGEAEIIIQGDAAKFVSADVFYSAPWRDDQESDYGYRVDLPMMIVNGGSDWEAFREWFLARKFSLLKRRLTCKAAWRQNPDQEIGDCVAVQVNRRGTMMPMMAYAETIDYEGGVLRGETRTIGEVSI